MFKTSSLLWRFWEGGHTGEQKGQEEASDSLGLELTPGEYLGRQISWTDWTETQSSPEIPKHTFWGTSPLWRAQQRRGWWSPGSGPTTLAGDSARWQARRYSGIQGWWWTRTWPRKKDDTKKVIWKKIIQKKDLTKKNRGRSYKQKSESFYFEWLSHLILSFDNVSLKM